MQNIITAGSIAYDHVMTFNGLFSEVISQEKINNLSVSFLVANKSTHFGGCAGNIAYNLKLLEENPIIYGVVGNDFDNYKKWLKQNEIITKEIIIIKEKETAAASILSDLKGNQITMFYPGASGENPHMLLENYKNKDSYAIISPDNVTRMLHIIDECQRLEIPYLFDPGQQIHLFSKEQLINAIFSANGLCLNEYEKFLLQEKTGLKEKEITEKLDFLITTLAEKGSLIQTKKEKIEIPIVKPREILEPTGCGDAYRAGILKGLKNNYPWEKTGKIASLMATYNIEHQGTQNHRFTMQEFKARYKKEFGEEY